LGAILNSRMPPPSPPPHMDYYGGIGLLKISSKNNIAKNNKINKE
jgi:hypothetical protein